MSGAIGGVISSVAEGVQALGTSVKEAAEGDWGEAGKQFARAGLEAAGIAGQALAGPGGPAVESIQESIEGALDSAALEKGTGDAPPPTGGGASFDVGGMLSGAAEGALGSIGGAGGALGQVLGGSGGSIGKVLGAVTGGGGAGSGLEEMLGGVLESGQIGGFTSKVSDVGEAAGMLEALGEGGSEVADELLHASVGRRS